MRRMATDDSTAAEVPSPNTGTGSSIPAIVEDEEEDEDSEEKVRSCRRPKPVGGGGWRGEGGGGEGSEWVREPMTATSAPVQERIVSEEEEAWQALYESEQMI